MKTLSPTTMVLGGLAGAGLLYLIFKPSDAKAEDKQPPASVPTKQCPGGAIVDVSKPCPEVQPATPAETPPITQTPQCQALQQATNTAAVPVITPVASGLGAPVGQALAPFGLSALPAVNVKDPATVACIEQPATNALVFLQAWKLTAGGYQPVFPDVGPAPAVAIIVSNAAGTGLAKAQDPALMFKNMDSYVSGYFDPKQNPHLDEMEAGGSFVLIWTTDAAGAPIAWWLTSWLPPSNKQSGQQGAP